MWIQDLQRVKSDREKGGQEKKSLRLAAQTLPSRKFSSHLPGREDARKILFAGSSFEYLFSDFLLV